MGFGAFLSGEPHNAFHRTENSVTGSFTEKTAYPSCAPTPHVEPEVLGRAGMSRDSAGPIFESYTAA